MIKKGLNLFTSSGGVLEKTWGSKYIRCCDVCQTPSLFLCQFICKYRRSTMKEMQEELHGKRSERIGEETECQKDT